MITRERMLSGFKELVHVEEGITTMLANFTKALLEHTEDIDSDKKKEMNKLLTRLYKDSSRHWEMLEEMMHMVEEEDKDEY